ncbi:ABC transporter ATP binding/permease protein [Butyrivibrio proteoclasticus B316]|uniref:ABC transporter ATP binding/permease protein n=1 Tax=Butyrivibrio proteoclasticus (strain ATCC 51982 / DSM 14932 / B316) TaxID=515622 RepID=E0S363_BUTPB|nr:ABC transporter ATP-binding protein [Butyrivibrio proteoclasticus]ADL35845.1 ABC transporter ATP binding/permease protein [Butyrivibrio proteoclasticus B316]
MAKLDKDSKENVSTFHKIRKVITLLFSSAYKKYPGFFMWESIKAVSQILQPFVAILISPLIVDEIVGDRNLSKLIILAASLIIGEFVISMITSRSSTELNKYQQRLDDYFAILMGKHSMELDYQLTEDKEALDQIEKARTGMSWYSGGVYGISEIFFMFITNIIRAIGFVIVIALHAPLLLLLLAIYSLVNLYVVSKQNKIEIEAFGKLSKVNRLFGYFGWDIVDTRFGKDIRLYDAQKLMVECWEHNTDKSNKHWRWQALTQLPYSIGVNVISAIKGAAAYFYVGLLAIKGVYGIGTFVQLISTEAALNGTLSGLVWNVTELIKNCNYAYEYVLFMEYPEALPKGEKEIAKKPHEIEFRHVSFSYPKTDKKILDDICIKIRPGEHLSIVGLNGAGKTTFIKLLCRLYDPTEGQILLDGVDIRDYDYRQYMQQFAPVFQDFKLFSFTIDENIAFANPDKGKVDEYIELVGLKDKVDELEKGTQTTIFKYFDEKGIEPSGGEQQKIAIARALYKDSPVVILDEPTSALDPLAEYEVYKQFHTLVGGKTAFYISHRLSSCKFCDSIAVFSEGKIAEYGSHDELISIPSGIYAKMFEAQAKYYRDAS